jgi:hypothetical protein
MQEYPIYNHSPKGCPLAGFYADLGHTLTQSLGFYLNDIYNSIKTNKFIVNIDSTNMWVKYQTPNQPIIDYYKELFAVDLEFDLPLPITGITRDNWTIIKDTDFTDLNNILKKYFKMSAKQELLYSQITQNCNFIPEKTIGVHYRGTDKVHEVPLEDAKNYIVKINDIISTDETLRVFIETDQEQVRDLFIKTYKERCFFNTDIPVTSGNTGLHQMNCTNKYDLARYLEISVRMLAKCKYLFLGMSNVATFIGAHRNNPANVFQFINKYV